MSTEDRMTIDERYKYLCRMRQRYLQANQQERGRLLDEMQAVTDLHHKSLIRLISGSLARKPRRRQRGRTYGPEMESALCIIAESFDYICAERLTPNLPWMAQHLDTHGEHFLSPLLLDDLDKISVSTVRRILARHHPIPCRLPRRPPSRPKGLAQAIPMQRIPYNTTQPGHPSASSGCNFEVDLVHHSGPDPSRQYVHSLQMVDVATGWSERRAALGRSWLVVSDAFRHILAHLPFGVHGIHSDNRSEFLNYHLLQFWGEAAENITLSRSRPYQKYDNPFVEQKNSSLIRAYLGHERLDTVAQTCSLNELYHKMGHYWAFAASQR